MPAITGYVVTTMFAMAWTVLVLSAGPLDSADPAARVKAVAAWAQKNAALRLPKLDVEDGAPACFEVKAPAELSCARSVWGGCFR